MLYASEGFQRETGYSQDTLRHLPRGAFFELIHNDDRENARRMFLGQMTPRRSPPWFDLEFRLRTAQGNWIWCRARDTELNDAQGQATGLRVGSLMDISHSRAILNDLDQFAHVAAHDLREPTQRLSIYTDLLAGQMQHNPEAAQTVELIQQSVSELDQLIAAFRQLTNLTPPGDAQREQVDLQALVKRILDHFKLTYPTARYQLKGLSQIPVVFGYATLLQILLENLLSNAMKHGPAGMTIEFQSRMTNSGIEIGVINTGSRFSQGQIARGVASLQKRNDGRRSLGLAICKRVIDLHDGRIWLEPSDDAAIIRFLLPQRLC